MEKVKKRNRSIILIVAFILLTLTVRPEAAYGALGIDTAAKCSITFDLTANGLVIQENTTAGVDADGFKELNTLQIEVELYKVADVNVSGRYVEPKEDTTLYQALRTDLSGVTSNKTEMAEKWETMARNAMTLVDQKIKDEQPISKAATTKLNDSDKNQQEPADDGIFITDNGKKINNLSTGLYLVVVRDAKSSQYIYHFSPYLVSLPGNNYGKNDSQGNPSMDDTWLYDLTVGLKPGRENLYGDLKIVKTLKSYNATLGGATFIFQVESEPKDGISFSDVVSITFDSAGTREYLLADRIPAGATVKVTEVYTGASYKVTSDSEKTATIVASDPGDPNNPSPSPIPQGPTTVTFDNDYDERLNKGTSIVNLFEFTKNEGDTSGGVWNYVDKEAEPSVPGEPDQEAGGQ